MRSPTIIVTLLLLAAGFSSSAEARVAGSTAYCLTGQMANGQNTHKGSVAMNRHPLGTRIYLTGRTFRGQRRFTVRDRIGHGSELDFWTPRCSDALRWGRRTVNYRIGWPKRR